MPRINIPKSKDVLSLLVSNDYRNHPDPLNLLFVFHALQAGDLLLHGNIVAAAAHQNTYSLAIAIEKMLEIDALNAVTLDLILHANNPILTADAIKLCKSRLFTYDNVNALLGHPNMAMFESIFDEMWFLDLFTQENFDLLLEAADPSYTAKVIFILNDADSLSRDNVNLVVKNHLLELLETLNSANILCEVSVREVLKYKIEYAPLNQILQALQQTGLLDFDTFKTVLEHKSPDSLLGAVDNLTANDLLTASNLKFILEEPPRSVSQVGIFSRRTHPDPNSDEPAPKKNKLNPPGGG